MQQIDAANAVIQNNDTRLGKNLWTAGEEGEPVKLYTAFDERDEARFVIDQIQNWIGQRKLPKNIGQQINWIKHATKIGQGR